ncbi:hypothetical protein F5I97DRAFT_748627 [Phlebopus sp. FC_14]|nr:hypothetical protein F5I97DRAFT_748627 [Phlebopus sp. FC_14]
MTDLLPPSPSSLMLNTRPSLYSPNLLGSTGISDKPAFACGSRVDANASTVSLPVHRSTSPPHSHGRSRPSLAKFSSLSLSSVPLVSTLAVLPLDLYTLMESQEATNTYLARMVDDLTRWLSAVEAGFATMLDQTVGDAIVEEQEESTAEDGSVAIITDTDQDVYSHAKRPKPLDVST